MTKFVFLYTEISGYFLACVKKLAEMYDAEIHVFRYPVNKEAPFNFPEIKNVIYYERAHLDFTKLQSTIERIKPDFLYCAGWIDKEYIRIIKKYSGKIPTVLGFDNKWENSLKQRIAALAAPWVLTGHFSHCFVPGSKQKTYALKLGFSEKQIISGLYSADVDLFNKYYISNLAAKKTQFPKKFIYAARYVKHKGIADLWDAFSQLQEESPNEWELWCIGTGDVPPVIHPKIKHFGFVQPAELGEFIAKTGVYVLPSHFEPWGVSLHEFAAAGFPLICSDQVGAAEKFIVPDKNGFMFESGNVSSLKNCFKRIINMPQQQLLKMAEESVETSMAITPGTWADAVSATIKKQVYES